MKTHSIPPEVLQILNSSTITDRSVTLPSGQLPRPLYEAVNKVLTNAGGKWNRSSGAHLFTSDPRQKLRLTLETGKTINHQQVTQAFYTPPDLASELVHSARVQGCSVLEPSAGRGALVRACLNAGASCVNAVEQDPDACNVLNTIPGIMVAEADFLTLRLNSQWDRVVMNPPFTNNQDVKHVIKALTHLAPGGRLVSVMGGNITRTCFQMLVDEWKAEVVDLPENSFRSSGTNVKTVAIAIDK